MKWLFCLAKPPVLGEEAQVALKGNDAIVLPKHKQQPTLEKQDSAFLDRQALREPRGVAEDPVQSYEGAVSAELSISESADGKAASLRKFGPPKPICNEARLANLKELGVMDRPSGDPEIQHIMQLMCTVFNTESALVALVGDDHIFIHDAINFKKGDFAWRQSFCAHTMTPANHQVMVIENANEDARFSHLPLVKGGQVQFYAGTPLVSSKGHRLGTVCFASNKPRKFDAEGCNMLTNMGELVCRELEREWAAKLQAKAISSQGQEAPQLLRAIECFNEAVLFVDVSALKWKILHLNAAAQTKLKLYGIVLDVGEDQNTCLWNLFQPSSSTAGVNSEAPWQSFEEDIKAGRKFEVSSARFNSRHSHQSARSPAFTLTFRSAANDVIDSNCPLVGAPAYMPMTESNRQFYFVTLGHGPGSNSHSSTSSIRSMAAGVIDPESVPFDNVELGPLLGKGGYGRVYRGIRDNEVLAVKVIDNTASLRMLDGQPLETAITRDTKHPNVVNTLDYAITSATGDSDSDTGEERFDSANSRHKRHHNSETWLLLEFCDCGCLQEASDKGFFRPDGQLNLAGILSVAADIASGMAFLHERGVAHGDLTGGNVLLASNPYSPVGVTAKIADFGLARALDVQSKIETRTYGTVTHMPPELLEKGIFSKAADTFALGVLMWEMYHGVRAWSSMNHAQIITAVAVNHRSLEFAAGAPKGYVNLALALMSQDSAQRPTFEQALASIKEIQTSLP